MAVYPSGESMFSPLECEVSFLLAFSAVFEECVRPYALASQQAVEPWINRVASSKMLQKIDAAIAGVESSKRLLSVLVLLRQHLSPKETGRFIVAWSAQPFCRCMFDFWLLLPGLVAKIPPMMRNCTLQQQDEDLGVEAMCLGPHCQCASRVAHKKNPSQCKVVIRGRRSTKRRRSGSAGRAISVPPWVGHSDATVVCPDPSKEVGPRYQVLSTPPPTGQRGSFRLHVSGPGAPQPCHHPSWCRGGNPCPCTWSSRCQVPLMVYKQHADVQKALSATSSFLVGLRENMAASLGNAGVNERMQQLFRDASEAWDWEFLLRNRPLQRHVEAFLRLVKTLKGTLEHTHSGQKSASPIISAKKHLYFLRPLRQVLSNP